MDFGTVALSFSDDDEGGGGGMHDVHIGERNGGDGASRLRGDP